MKVLIERDRDPAEVPVVLDARVVRGSGGGPDKTILNSPRFLQPMGYRNFCAYMHPPGDPGFETLQRKAEEWDAPLVSVPDRGPWDWRVVTRMLEICRREKVAIWHGHDYKSNLLGLIIRSFWPMHLVTTVHGWGVLGSRRTPLYNRLDRLCLPFYECVICVSNDLFESCLDCGVPRERCLLIQNAIDTKQFARSRNIDEAKKRLGILPGRLLIGAIGRLSREKGFDLLVVAVDRLIGLGFDVELRIAGEGDQQERLADLIRVKGREDRIRLVGFQKETIALYEAMDVFALSSLREGLPNVVLEAMALEVPVVATKVAGLPGLIQSGVNGLLVEPSSADELTDALISLLADPSLRTRLALSGRATIERHYGFKVRMEKVRAVYDGLLGRDRASAPTCEAVTIS